MEQASDDDVRKVQQLIRSQKEQLTQDLLEVQISMDNNSTRLARLRGEVGKAEKDLANAARFLDDTKAKYEEELLVQQKFINTEVEGFSSLQLQQELLQQNGGTSDVQTLIDRINDAQLLLKMPFNLSLEK